MNTATVEARPSSSAGGPPTEPAWRDVRRLAFAHLFRSDGVFERVVLLGADQSLVQAARDVGFAHEVDDVLGRPGTADLVAVLADAQRPHVGQVASELSPDGVVWWECDRRRAREVLSTPRRIAGWLRRCGLEATEVYTIRPDPARAEWYVPVDHPFALRWFIDCLHTPTSRHQMLTEAVLRSAIRVSPGLIKAFAPFHATLASRPDVTANRRQDTAALFHHGGSRRLIVSFGPTDLTPATITKIAHDAAGRRSLSHEYAQSEAVRGHAGRALAASVPRSIAVPSASRLIQEVLPGRPLARSLGRPGKPFEAKADELNDVVRWIGDLHSRPLMPAWSDDLVGEVEARLDPCRALCPPRTAVAHLLDNARDTARQYVDTAIPRVWEHGDLTLWNVLMADDAVNVVDWESARPGLPVIDVLRIVEQWHAEVLGLRTPRERAEGRGWLVDPPRKATAATRTARAAIDSYIVRLGLPPGFEAVAHVVGLATLAVRRDERLDRDGGVGGQRGPNIPMAQLGYLAAAGFLSHARELEVP